MDTKAEGLETWSRRSYSITRWRSLLGVAWSIALAVQIATPAFAGPREQAQRIYERIGGVPPSATVLDQMAAKTATGDLARAAAIATDASTFYRCKGCSFPDRNASAANRQGLAIYVVNTASR